MQHNRHLGPHGGTLGLQVAAVGLFTVLGRLVWKIPSLVGLAIAKKKIGNRRKGRRST